MKLKERILTMIFGVILVVSGIIRFNQTSEYNTAFTYDQARDLLDIRALGEFKDLAVLGPTTSINGLRLGPFYYYFNLPAYWLGNGDPQTLVYWNVFGFLFTGGFIFWFFKKKNINLGLLISTFFLMSPQLFNTTRYFWNANMATYLSVYFFLALWNFLDKKDKKSILWLGITSGLLTQFEAAFGIVCLTFSVLIVILNKKTRNWKIFLIGLVPWFLPQIALEIKNKFQMTKLLLGIFNGSNNVLGDKLAIGQVMESHWKTIKYFFEGQFILPVGWGIILLGLSIMLIIINKKYRTYGLYFLGFLMFVFIFYTVIYHHELKIWYLESLRVWYCFVVGIALANIKRYKKLAGILLIGLLSLNFYRVGIDQWQFVQKKTTDDPKNLNNLIKNIDWVYQKINGDGFEAYNYVPEVYDYPNQYLYWWYGIKKYGYMPNKVSYSLVEVPEYIRTQKEFYENTRENKNGKIALIYETKNSYIGWLNQFEKYCTVEKWETGWRTTVEIREKCKN
ncbi:MAG: hypothetical protein PHN66_02750 [Candidatus Shapirobacteria bacterium]|nr:hypothetical protein [Candidatus Shapirobacteria bacterium]